MEQLLANTTFYNQLITEMYLNGKKELEYLFPEMGIPEYMILHIIAHIDDTKEEKKGYVYLKELAEAMEMTMPQTSRLAQEMTERGLVEWSHDPKDASQGTYLKISVTGEELLKKQALNLKDNYEYICQEIGMEKIKSTLQTISEIRKLLTKRKENEEK